MVVIVLLGGAAVVFMTVWLVRIWQFVRPPAPPSTRPVELAWLDEAEPVAEAFLVEALGTDDLPDWERREFIGIGGIGGECSRAESVMSLPGYQFEVLDSLEAAALGAGMVVTYTPDVVAGSDGTTTVIVEGGELASIEVRAASETNKAVRLIVNTATARVRIFLVTECYPDPVGGTFPDE
jgi:hypothetical protein